MYPEYLAISDVIGHIFILHGSQSESALYSEGLGSFYSVTGARKIVRFVIQRFHCIATNIPYKAFRGWTRLIPKCMLNDRNDIFLNCL